MGQPVNLHIPEPCHESWANMKPQEHGRFCASCSKTVIDFSGMTDCELFEFFQNYSGGACGRFFGDQLNRTITVEQPKRTGWFRYVLTVLMPAMLVANRTAAQGMILKKAKTECTPAKVPKLMGDTVIIAAPKVDVAVTETKFESAVQPAALVGIAGGISITRVEEPAPVFHRFKKFITESFNKNSFSVFPNPATPGGMLTTSFKAKKGTYYIQFLDANGLLAQEQKLDAWSEKMDIQLPVSKNILPGLYTVLLVDDQRKRISSQKLIVQ